MDQANFVLLKLYFRRWLRWFRLHRGVSWAGYGLVAGLALGLLGGLSGAYLGQLLRPEYYQVIGGTALLGGMLALLAGVVWPVSTRQAACTFDKVFHLKERLSTALELAQPGHQPVTSPDMVGRQLDDTLLHARQVVPRRDMPIRLPRWKLFISAILVMLSLLYSWRAEKTFTAAAAQRQLEEAIAAQIEQIQELQASLEEDDTLTSEARQELIEILEQSLRQLESAETAEEAVSALTEARQELLELGDPQTQALSQALQSLGESLAQQADSPLAEAAQHLAQGEITSALEALADIDPAAMSAEELQALSEQLAEAAQALQSASPELSEQLNQAAEAMEASDLQAAQQALAEAAQSLQQAEGEINQTAAAALAASQLAASQQQIAQAAQGASAQSNQANQQGQGDSSSPSSQPGAAGGSGRGDSPDGDVTGAPAGDDPISQNNAPGDSGESPYQPLYPANHIGGSSDDLVTLPSSGATGEMILGQGELAPGEFTPSTVPYSQVYTYYTQVYRQAIENGDIPPAMRDLVRDYFTSLEP